MGKRPVLPHRTLRFQVGMYSLSVPIGTYQAGTQTPFFPWRSRDQTSFLFLLQHPWLLRFVTGQTCCPLCTVRVLLPGEFGTATKDLCPCQKLSTQCNPSPLSQSWVSVAGLETLPQWLQPTDPNSVPLPNRRSFFPYQVLQVGGDRGAVTAFGSL